MGITRTAVYPPFEDKYIFMTKKAVDYVLYCSVAYVVQQYLFGPALTGVGRTKHSGNELDDATAAAAGFL